MDEITPESARTEQVRAALGRPATYPQPPASVEIHETHISWVFVAGERAYKLKKPLVLDFLDYGTPDRRREMCREEVRLNRRLAADLYLGVCGVRLSENGGELTAEDDPRAADYVVEMRRYDERDTLAARLEVGELLADQVASVGRLLAAFHATARRVRAHRAPVLAAERRFEQNLLELLADLEQRVEIERIQALERFAHAFITAHAATFQRRAAEGWIREGHGDLRAEHVLVNGAVQVVDCVEFDPALRELDVADDLAFLVFDLAARGGERFGEVLVRAYRDAGGDPGEDRLIAFYATYRALVRAKVALLRAAQLPRTSAAHGHESAAARDLIALAERFAWRARLPLTLAVCGAPASGKSRLAEALSKRSGFAHLSSDVTRKRLAGLKPTQRAGEEAYSLEWNARTYGELGRRAACELAAGRGAIVDATFRHRTDREAFAAAFAGAGPVLFVECQAPRSVLAQRAARRAGDHAGASDADVRVTLREQRAWEALEEVPAGAHIAVRTDRDVEYVVGDTLALLDRRLLELA
ncbi:MAG TPA: AAA family ATPase [Solirubrobacteraceae bacterium]|nr:AAA family ATPase [Solirubrobacteraceae bacterium]